jgi:hypothetical protein
VEKYGTDREATDDIIQRICAACWITKVTDRQRDRQTDTHTHTHTHTHTQR